MLNKRKLAVTANIVVNDACIASLGAVVDVETGKVQFASPRFIDSEACEEHRAIVRADRDQFEDFVYDLKNDAMAMAATDVPVEDNNEDA